MKNLCWAVLVSLIGTWPLSAAPDTPAATPAPSQILAVATELIRAARYCTFVTVDEGGQPQARVVDPFSPEPDMTVWVATKRLTRKVAQIRLEILSPADGLGNDPRTWLPLSLELK